MSGIELKKNPKMKLDIPEFNCDHSPLGEHLNEYDMLRHLNCFGFTGIIGKPGSGKTSWLISTLTGKGDKKVFRKVFDHVLLVMPSQSRNSLKKNPFKKHDAGKMWDDLDYGVMDSIYNKLLASSAEKETTMLILDDVGASLKNKEIQTLLRKIIYNRRHLKCHIFMMLQSFISIPKEVRKLFTNVVMFKPSKVEFQNLFDELFETKKDMADAIMRFTYDRPHVYLFMNVETQKLYKNFDEIVLPKEDDDEAD